MLSPDLVARDAIIPSLRVHDKRALFVALADRAGLLTGIDPSTVLTALLASEATGTTGFGGGVALPYARLDGITHPVALFARLDEPVDYAALDGVPVDLVFLLLSPSAGSAEHLMALARASRAMRDRALTAKLRGASSADSLYALLAGAPQARAA